MRAFPLLSLPTLNIGIPLLILGLFRPEDELVRAGFGLFSFGTGYISALRSEYIPHTTASLTLRGPLWSVCY